MDVQGLVFDCDGTLVDSMPPHYEAWVEILKLYELELSEARFYALGGWPTERVAELLIAESGRALDAAAISHEKEAAFRKFIHLVKPIEPVVAVARAARGKLPMAVATGGIRPICEALLRQVGLLDWFDTIVTCEDVRNPKPAPDVFLEAARRLGVPPENCRAYEDTDPGIEAARRAGMDVVDIRTLREQVTGGSEFARVSPGIADDIPQPDKTVTQG